MGCGTYNFVKYFKGSGVPHFRILNKNIRKKRREHHYSKLENRRSKEERLSFQKPNNRNDLVRWYVKYIPVRHWPPKPVRSGSQGHRWYDLFNEVRLLPSYVNSFINLSVLESICTVCNDFSEYIRSLFPIFRFAVDASNFHSNSIDNRWLTWHFLLHYHCLLGADLQWLQLAS